MKAQRSSKKGLSLWTVVEALGLLLGDGLLFDGHDLKTGLVDFGQNGPGETLADRVRLDDAEGALRHESVLLDGEIFLSALPL
jgi:hypothetical protein